MKREEWNRNWERLSPDEAAKKRMQERLLQAAAAQSAPKKQKPWLTIWKRPLQVGTFAAVCAALAILVQQQGLLEVRQQQQTMLESAAEQTTQTTTAAQEQQAASNPTAESSKQTQPASITHRRLLLLSVWSVVLAQRRQKDGQNRPGSKRNCRFIQVLLRHRLRPEQRLLCRRYRLHRRSFLPQRLPLQRYSRRKRSKKRSAPPKPQRLFGIRTFMTSIACTFRVQSM